MSMYNHARSRARVLRAEDAFQSHVLMHSELLTARVPELIVQLALVVAVFIVMGYVASMYLRALTHVSTSPWNTSVSELLEHAESNHEMPAPRVMHLPAPLPRAPQA